MKLVFKKLSKPLISVPFRDQGGGCICSVALSLPVAGIPFLVTKRADGNTGFQGQP